MRKPIIVFSLVMVLAPLPTIIPWLYDTWRSEENTSWHAAPPRHFQTTEYTSMDDAAALFTKGTGTNLDKTATDDINGKDEWGCFGLRDERIHLTNLFYH